MANARNEILSRYSQAAEKGFERGEKLSPAEYMLATNPGDHPVNYRGKVYYSKYSNAGSASRAFRKVRSGETSGEKMYARGNLFPYSRGRERGFEMDRHKGGAQLGLWKVVIHMNWVDQDGNVHEMPEGAEERSFIVESSSFFSYYDAKTVEYEVGDAIEEHVANWENDYGVSNVEIVSVEIIKIQSTRDPTPVEIE